VVLSVILLCLSVAYATVVSEIVIESARLGGRGVVAFGTTLLTTETSVGIFVLAGLSASAALALVAAVAFHRGRRLERRMAGELDARYEDISTKAAGWEARNELLRWRIAELQNQQEQLLAKREELMAEMTLARQRASDLRAVAQQQRDALEELQRVAEGVVIMPELDEALLADGDDDTVIVPGADSEVPVIPPGQPRNQIAARLADAADSPAV
jgi:hypothetical protein